MKENNTRKQNIRRLVFEGVLVFLIIVLTVGQILVVSHFEMPDTARIILTVIALVEMAIGIAFCAVLEMSAGGFECRSCGHYFVPTKLAYLFGAHTIMYRRLRCPKCGKRGWARRRLSPPDEGEQ